MQPVDASLVMMLDGSKQFIIPRFQRSYTWNIGVKNSKVKRFWEDILESYYSSTRHFTGSIVFTNTNLGTFLLPCHYIVDGQQRLMTTSLMLCAFHKVLSNDPSFKDICISIEKLLSNEIESAYGERLKIVPSEKDYSVYNRIVNGKPRPEDKDHIVSKVFNYFVKEIQTLYDDEDFGKEGIKKLYSSILEKIHVCAILIDDGEDPGSIFESLNGKGEILNRIDLVRNYILMNLLSIPGPNDYQKKFYDQHWKDFESSFDKPAEAESFLRSYLMIDGSRVTNSNLYDVVRELIDKLVDESRVDGQICQDTLFKKMSEFMETVERHLGYYQIIIGKSEFESALYSRTVKRSFENLKQIGASTFRPFMLKAFEAYHSGAISEEDFVQIVRTVDSYFMRRSMYIGLVNNKVDGLFINLCKSDEISLRSLFETLSSQTDPKTFWPTDSQLLCDVFSSKPMYSDSGNDTLTWVLHRMDEKENGKPLPFNPTDDTIEHIFPRTPAGTAWESCSDYDYMCTHRDYLGNLTLSDHNGNHARRPYSEKRTLYIQIENHPMTRKLAEKYEEWNKNSIETRTGEMTQSIVSIWPRDKLISEPIPRW